MKLRQVGPVWQAASVLIALGVLAPVVSLAWLALGADFSHWQHLLRYVLPDAAVNTGLLLFSSITYGIAMIAMQARSKRGVLVWLAITGLLGAGFIGLEL